MRELFCSDRWQYNGTVFHPAFLHPTDGISSKHACKEFAVLCEHAFVYEKHGVFRLENIESQQLSAKRSHTWRYRFPSSLKNSSE